MFLFILVNQDFPSNESRISSGDVFLVARGVSKYPATVGLT